MTNNNQVNWDEIPEDVEAVVTYPITEDTFFKKIDGELYSQCWRHSIYKKSGWDKYSDIAEHFGDRFHLRPSPTTQPAPEPPESTQVESSEGGDTTTPEFDWSSVEDDVEAVFLFENNFGERWSQGYKTVGGVLLVAHQNGVYEKSSMTSLNERIERAKNYGFKFHVRPPATTPPSEKVTCKVEFYEGELPEGMIDLDDVLKPSISTILQEAQQSILKHHGVTGKVKFTVTCSE